MVKFLDQPYIGLTILTFQIKGRNIHNFEHCNSSSVVSLDRSSRRSGRMAEDSHLYIHLRSSSFQMGDTKALRILSFAC